MRLSMPDRASRNVCRGEDYCEHAGHEWVAAGGGMFICAVCQAEELDPIGFDIGEGQDAISWERGGSTS